MRLNNEGEAEAGSTGELFDDASLGTTTADAEGPVLST